MAKYKKRKDGMYEKKVQNGYKPDGTPNRISIYARSVHELEEKALELKMSIKAGEYTPADSQTLLEDYAKEWFSTYKSMKGINTKAMYQNIIEKHIIPDLGFLKLCDIKKNHIQLMINERKEHRRTCEQILMTLKQIFESAAEEGLISKNPCKKIELPPKKPGRKRALTTLEKEAMKNADFTPKERAFIYILYGCGLRREEILALTKEDISKEFITVNKVLVYDKNIPLIEQRTKSDSSCRNVNLPESVFPYLSDYMHSVDTFYLFTNKDGQIMPKSTYDYFWKQIVRKMNTAAGGDDKHPVIDGLTAHIFRHNYATLLYYSGISLKKAVELMGHSDEKMIMGVYAHLDEEKENAAQKINHLITL